MTPVVKKADGAAPSEGPDTNLIAVVIPYFQRDADILKRALASIYAQENPENFRIYIVDDESPAPPEPEILAVPVQYRQNVLLLKQKNAGPGPARNAALNAIKKNIGIIAFLDSDDYWLPGHITSAVQAVESGADFYFSNFRRDDRDDTHFDKAKYAPETTLIDPARPDLRWCDKDALVRQSLLSAPMATPTVVVRRSLVEGEKFRTDLKSAGEDVLRWIDLMKKADKIACSTTVQVLGGRGVNVFDHRSWGGLESVQNHMDIMNFYTSLSLERTADADYHATIRQRLKKNDIRFFLAWIACVRRGKFEAGPMLFRFVWKRPGSLQNLPTALGLMVQRRTEGSSTEVA